MRWRWVDLPLRAKSLVVIAIPMIPLLLSSLLFAVSAQRGEAAHEAIAQSLRVKAQIATVFGSVVDAETGVRGYLLTRSDEARRVYQDATAIYQPEMARLATMIADNPVQVEHSRTVAALAARRPLTSLLEYADQRGPSAPVPLALLAESRATLAALRREFTQMQQVEDQVLAARTGTVAVAERRQLQASVLAVALGLLGAVIGAVAFSAGIVARIRRVGDNATRLATGQALHPLPPAGDEVGQLSAGLDQAAALLARRVHEMQDTRDELDRFFSLSLDMLCIVGPDGRFTRVNPAWSQTLGWSDTELCAVPYLDFVHPDDIASTTAAGEQLAAGASVINFENRYRCQDGSYRWLQWQAAPSAHSHLVYATAHDITERKQAADELESRAAALTAANQELEAFSYSVSHDLRAPLRHVTGFASLLQRNAGPQLDQQAQRYVATIESAAKRMGQLIDDLLAFSRMGRAALTKRRVALDQVVREAQREVVAHIDGREVVWSVGALPEVDADPALLRLAFVNLLSNALKYSAGRAETRIEVGSQPCEDGQTVVFVRDNGVGFDMAYAHKLFGVFQRLHSSSEFEGTGIGLANVRRIIQRHGGRTWAEGAIDDGATFYFSLPHEACAA